MVNRETSGYRLAVAAILMLGVALRTVEYGALGSFWIDELFIALNVTTRGWWELVSTPLAYNQVAPVGFLLATKLGSVLLGETEAGLRLFPYLASLLGLLLFWRVGQRFLEPVAGLGALAIFALSPTLLWYARNVKQYSGDVTVVLLLVLLALRFREGRQRSAEAAIAGLLGGFAILFSQPAVLVAPVLLAGLLVQQRREQKPVLPLVWLGGGWAIGAAVVIMTSLILSPLETREFMRAGWEGRGFMPLGVRALTWVPHRLLLLMGLFVGEFSANTPSEIVVAGTFVVLAGVGAFRLLRRSQADFLLLISPVLAGILASAARLLPLSRRVSLYAVPVLLVCSLAGVDEIRRWLPARIRGIADAGIGLLVAVPAAIVLFLVPVPQRREEARPVLQAMHARWQAGDLAFVVRAGGRAMEFYGVRLGLDPWVEAASDGSDPRGLLRDVDAFRGRRRLWVFYAHVDACPQEMLRSYLKAIGTELDRIEDPYGKRGKSAAAAYLYDLSDPVRLARSNAETYPAPAVVDENCRELPPARFAEDPAGD